MCLAALLSPIYIIDLFSIDGVQRSVKVSYILLENSCTTEQGG